MENAINKEQAEQFANKFGSLCNKGYPFASKKLDASKRIFTQSQPIKGADVELNKFYVLRQGLTIAERVDHPYGNYFQRDSLIMLVNKNADPQAQHAQAEVYIIGQTFYVTSNPGFANQSATWIDPKMTKKGYATLAQLHLMEVEDALKAIGD